MPVKLQSSSGGSVTLDVPVTASNYNLTVPAASGTAMVSGNMPVFQCIKTSNQSFSSSTDTKVTYDSKIIDTHSIFNTSNSRFTPNVAGYYLVHTNTAIVTPPSSSYAQTYLYKNGSFLMVGTEAQITSGTYTACAGNHIVYCNGSTDYFEIYLNSGISSSIYGYASIYYTYVQGYLLRAA